MRVSVRHAVQPTHRGSGGGLPAPAGVDRRPPALVLGKAAFVRHTLTEDLYRLYIGICHSGIFRQVIAIPDRLLYTLFSFEIH